MIDYMHPEEEPSDESPSRSEVAETFAQLRAELTEHEHGQNWGGFFPGETTRRLDP